MALEQEKKGGPYSKDEREKRQNEVFRLHFEFGYSAIKIADLMKINRNTINADIKYWYSNRKEEIKQDSEDFILRQLGRLEAQRSRNIENIIEKKIDDVKHEKLLLDIDKEINRLLRISSDKQVVAESVEIKEDVIKDIILFLIIKHNGDYCLKRENIISEIINLQKCTIVEANTIFSQIGNLGLECCKKMRLGGSVYDLLEFAYLRRYVLENETFVINVQTLQMLHIHIEAEKIELRKKYEKEYGSVETWTNEEFEKYDEDKNKVEKHTKTTRDLLVGALDYVSSPEQVEDYIKYMNVFFGQKEKSAIEELLE